MTPSPQKPSALNTLTARWFWRAFGRHLEAWLHRTARKCRDWSEARKRNDP